MIARGLIGDSRIRVQKQRLSRLVHHVIKIAREPQRVRHALEQAVDHLFGLADQEMADCLRQKSLPHELPLALLFCQLAGVDVLDDAHHPQRPAVGVAYERCVALDPDEPLVFSHEPFLGHEFLDLAANEEAGLLPIPRYVLGTGDVFDGQCQQLPTVVAGDLAHPAIDPKKSASFRIDLDPADARELEHGPVARLALAKGLLSSRPSHHEVDNEDLDRGEHRQSHGNCGRIHAEARRPSEQSEAGRGG